MKRIYFTWRKVCERVRPKSWMKYYSPIKRRNILIRRMPPIKADPADMRGYWATHGRFPDFNRDGLD